MKIIVFYKEVYGSYPTSLESEKTAAGIEAFFKMNDFVKLNREKKNFYSATINGYLDYLDQLKIVNAGESKESPSERYKIKLLKKPVRKSPVQTTILQYPRNPHEMLAAKHRSGWKCCYDSSHETFISENDHKNFVEGHHLIPMQHQCDFEYTIDFADNIIPLCPACHRRIHFAIKQDRNRMLEKFYFERIDDIKVHGIDISIDELESYYV